MVAKWFTHLQNQRGASLVSRTGADHGRRGTGFTTTVIKFYDQKYEVLGKILK